MSEDWKPRPRWEWLATATEEDLVRSRILRDGRCMDCGAPPSDADARGECPFCRTDEGIAFHEECDRLGLDEAGRRARRAAQIRPAGTPDPRQLTLL